jgi:hypothetical protein
MKSKSSRRRARRRSRSSAPRIEAAPRTSQEYFALPLAQQDVWDSISQVPARMRSDNVSLAEAARDLGVSPDEVVRLARPAFRKLATGQYAARPTDQIFRMLHILSPDQQGLIEFPTTDSREASVVGRFWNGIRFYVRTGDSSELESLERRTVKNANGKRLRLLTDLDEIETRAHAGELRFESIYGAVA